MGGIHGVEMEDGSDGWKIHGVDLILGLQSTVHYWKNHGGGMEITNWMDSWSGVGLCIEKRLQQHY